jgi:predicted RND superfamily exporter protein
MSNLIHLYAEALVRYRWAVLILMLLLTGWLASRIGVLQLNNDPDIWAPQAHEFTRTTRELERVFGGRNITVIGIVARRGDVYDPAVLQKIRNIQSGIEALPEAIKNNIVSFAARRVKDIQGNADGMTVREMLEPLPQTPQDLASLKQAIERNPMYINSLVSPDHRAAAVIADFRVAGANAAYAPLYEKIRQVVDRERDDTVDIQLGGQPVHAANMELAMQKMPIYFGIAFLIILTVQFVAFRSIQGMVLPMLTGILAVVWGLGLMALAGLQLDALNTTTPILIMAVATGHAVQILKRYYEELAKIVAAGTGTDLQAASRQAVCASLVQMAPVMLTAGLIAATAFLSLCISDVRMIRNFGIFAGAGVLAALIIELTLIPALRAILPARLQQTLVREGRIDRILVHTGRWLTTPAIARKIITVALAVVVVVSLGALRVTSDNSFKQYFPPGGTVLRDDAVLNRSFGGTDSIAFLIEGDRPDRIKDTRVLQAMAKLQAFLESQPHVGKTQSLADLIKRMNQAMHGEDPAFGVVPQSSDLISQYLLLYSSSGDPEDFDTLVDTSYQRAVVWTYLKTDSTVYAQELYKKSRALIDAEFPQGVTVRLGGSVPQTVASNEALVTAKITNIIQMAVIVFLFASVVFRSPVGGLLVVIPLVAIVLMNLGIMGWLGIPLDMGTASITTMVTGIGADYEIYMLYRLREEYARQGDLNRALQTSLLTSGKAVLFVALSIAGGYSALLISDFRFYPRLGSTMMITMVISALLSLVFLRALVAVVRPRFIVGGPRVVATPLRSLLDEGVAK